MKKQMEDNNREYRTEELIQKTMSREFPLPESVERAKGKAFAQIRERQAQEKADQDMEEAGQKVLMFRKEAERKQEQANRIAEAGKRRNRKKPSISFTWK